MIPGQADKAPDAAVPHPGDQAAEQVSTARPLVLFDGACPLCAREIGHYRRLRGAERLDWIDISREPDLEARCGIRPADAMARLHVRDAQGRWLTGAWAFAELWSHLPGYRLAGSGLRRLHLLPLLDRAYTGFARWRLARRCASGACGAAPAARSNGPSRHP